MQLAVTKSLTTLSLATLVGLTLCVPSANAATTPTPDSTSNSTFGPEAFKESLNRTSTTSWANGWSKNTSATVNGTQGVLNVAPGKTVVTNHDTEALDAIGSYKLTIPKLETGKSVYSRIQLRKQGETYYSAAVSAKKGGPSYLQLEKVINGKTTILSTHSIPTLTEGTQYTLDFLVDGDKAVDLKARIYTGAKAGAWNGKFTDSSANRITKGTQVGVSAYLQSNATKAVAMKYDDVFVNGYSLPTVSDDMNRTNSANWGTGWTIERGSNFSNTGTEGLLDLVPGRMNIATHDAKLSEGIASYDLRFGNLPASQYVYTRIMLRKEGDTYYSAVLRAGGGSAHDLIQLERVKNGKTTVLNTVTVPKLKANKSYKFESSVLGLNDVNLGARVHEVGATQPAWQSTAKDSSADKLTKGTHMGISGYLDANAPTRVKAFYDNVTAKGKLVSPPVTPPGQNGAEAPRNPEVMGNWGAPVMADDFSASGVDSTKWRVRDGDYMSYDWAMLYKENITQNGDGNLVISAKRLKTPVVKKDGRERIYSGGYMDTIGKFSQEYGRWEIRAKIPLTEGKSAGFWPAFWLRPDDSSLGGEIDFLEAYGTPVKVDRDPRNQTEGTVHFDQSGNNKKSGWTPKVTPRGNVKLDSEYHIWAGEKTPEGIKFYFDNILYHTIPSTDPGYAKAFPKGAKYNIRVNFQIGSPYWGQANDQTMDQGDYKIDYIRAWAYPGK